MLWAGQIRQYKIVWIRKCFYKIHSGTCHARNIGSLKISRNVLKFVGIADWMSNFNAMLNLFAFISSIADREFLFLRAASRREQGSI